jgi:hypothetical protein
MDSSLYDEMKMEMYVPKPEKELPAFVTKPIVRKEKSNILDGLVPISKLPTDHPCIEYIQSRNIPNDDLFYTSKFMTWANKIDSEKYKIPPHDQARLIIPLRDENKKITAVQGRLLEGEGIKYISIAIDENAPLIWGLDRIRKNRHIIVLEGPFDAMFLPNAIACCGSDITTDLKTLNLNNNQYMVVYDNEPRSKFTIKKMKKAIDKDFPVCIWPESVKEKDVNEMIIKRIDRGLDEASYFVWNTIKNNIYSGLAAEAAMLAWAKVKV